MTFIQVIISQFLTLFVVHAVDAKTIQRVADEHIVFCHCLQARARAMVMVLPVMLWMPVTVILHFMRNGIAASIIQCIEKWNAPQRYPNHTHRQAA